VRNKDAKKRENQLAGDVHKQTEARDAGEGGGQGGAGQRELAEVADEHDGDHLHHVLQEEADDERPGEVQLLLDLGEHRALLAAASSLVGALGGKELFLHAPCSLASLA
jgi:hypothetical protein